MNAKLTREETTAVTRIKAARTAYGAILILLIIAVFLDLVFLMDAYGSSGGSSDIPEWFIIPFTLGIGGLGAITGMIIFLGTRLKDRERAYFVRISVDALKSTNSVSPGTLNKIFTEISNDLISRSGTAIVNSLVADGWPEIRAVYYTGLMDSLINKSEWNINYEDQVADFTKLLRNQRWDENNISALITPVVELIKNSGGRQTRKAVSKSIFRNVAWIIAILILTPILISILASNENLGLGVKIEFLQILMMVIPALLGLGWNIAAIISKLRSSAEKPEKSVKG